MILKANTEGGYLLTIDDDPLIQSNNKRILESHGYSVRQAFTLSQARAFIEECLPCAIVLEIIMPDGCGFDFLRELRKRTSIPVLVLSSKDMLQDIIAGFDIGADDYMSKPYEPSVFVMRLAGLMRLASLVPEKIIKGPLSIDVLSGKAYLNEKDLRLQRKELSLLKLFMQRPKQIISSEELYEKVWGEKMIGGGNALKVAISKLRTKLIGSGYTITASKHEGYYFEEEWKSSIQNKG